MLPKLAFISFASQYQAPQLNEGFQDITFVDFVVSPNGLSLTGFLSGPARYYRRWLTALSLRTVSGQ